MAATGVLSLVMVVIDRTVLMAEIPAGILILLSASAYGLGERRLGFGAAVLALFLRELTAPYVLVCAYLAWREGRRRELALWLVAVMAYGAYYLWHAHMVELVLLPADRTAPGWLQFGGATFLLRTAQFDGYFTTAPLWLIALMLPAAWLGLLAWPGLAGERVALTVTLYLVLFAVGGRSVNSYWGPTYTPLLIFGFAWLPPALRDLVRGLPRKLEQQRRPDALTEPTALVQ